MIITMFSYSYVIGMMQQKADEELLGPKDFETYLVPKNMHRQYSLWSNEDTEETYNTLFYCSGGDTLLRDLQQYRLQQGLCAELRKSDTSPITWHLLPDCFKYPYGTRLMEQACMQTNIIDVLRYCLVHPDLQSTDDNQLISLLKTIISLFPELHSDSQLHTHYTLMHMIKHRNMFNKGQPVSMQKITSLINSKSPTNIQSNAMPLVENPQTPYQSIHAAPWDALQPLKAVATIHTRANVIEKNLTELQHTIQTMDNQKTDLFEIAAYAYRRVLEIQPFNTEPTISALAAVNSIIDRKKMKKIIFNRSLEKNNINMNCKMLQLKSLNFLANALKKQYVLEHTNSTTAQTIINEQPELIKKCLRQLIIHELDNDCIRICKKIDPTQIPKLLNQRFDNSWTLLHYACKTNRQHLITFFLSLGANPNITNQDGKTPFDFLTKHTLQKEKMQLTELPSNRTPDRHSMK